MFTNEPIIWDAISRPASTGFTAQGTALSLSLPVREVEKYLGFLKKIGVTEAVKGKKGYLPTWYIRPHQYIAPPLASERTESPAGRIWRAIRSLKGAWFRVREIAYIADANLATAGRWIRAFWVANYLVRKADTFRALGSRNTGYRAPVSTARGLYDLNLGRIVWHRADNEFDWPDTGRQPAPKTRQSKHGRWPA